MYHLITQAYRLNYLYEYFLGNKFQVTNFSSMIFYKTEIVGIIPLSITKKFQVMN